jgi:hypothetical protein
MTRRTAVLAREGVGAVTSQPEVDLAPLARGLRRHTRALVDDMIDILIDRIPELRDDEQVAGRLRASIESNVTAIQHLLEQPLDVELVDPPPGALQWSLRLAQRGIPLSVLWRAYHLCTARVQRFFAEELTRHAGSVEDLGAGVAAAGTLLNAYVDHVCERVGVSYETERQRWLRQQDAVRADRIQDLLLGRRGDPAAVEAGLGYRLHGRHVALVLWDGDPSAGGGLIRLQRLASQCCERVGGRQQPLVVARDESTVWAWIAPVGDGDGGAAAVLAEAVARAAPAVRGAVGEPGTGADGFGRSHREAVVAQSVALAAGDAAGPVTAYADVSTIGFLCQDLDRAREWVRGVLGPLAADDEPHEQLRTSVGAFLATGGSLSAASERLGCHKNTVNHRIRRAELALGRSVRERRVDLELALQACRWLGPAVLAPSSTA